MTLLEWMNFVEKVLGHVAWPIAFVVVVALFRREITTFLQRVKKATYKGVEFDLTEEIKELKSDAEAAGVTVLYPNSTFSEMDFEKLNQAPEWAFIQSWQEIEGTLRKYSDQKDKNKFSARRLVNVMHQDGKIDFNLFTLLNNLAEIRNKMVHNSNVAISRGELLEWLGIAKSVNNRLIQKLSAP